MRSSRDRRKGPRYTPPRRMDQSSLVHELVFLIGVEELGRRTLARRTGLSEMTVRLALGRLREEGLVALGKGGASLTRSGRRRFDPLLSRVKATGELRLLSLSQGPVSVAALLSCREERPAWQYRDLAIREGASALLLLRRGRGGWLFAHSSERIAAQNPEDARTIADAFPQSAPEDRLVIACGEDRGRTGLALWRVVTEILFPTT